MDVRQVCCEFLQSQLHPTNCLGIRAFADLHTCTQLLNQSHAFAGKPLAMHAAICESSPLAWACMHPWKMFNFVSPRAAFHWRGAGRGVPGSVSAAGVQPHLQRQTHRFHRGEGQKTQTTHTLKAQISLRKAACVLWVTTELCTYIFPSRGWETSVSALVTYSTSCILSAHLAAYGGVSVRAWGCQQERVRGSSCVSSCRSSSGSSRGGGWFSHTDLRGSCQRRVIIYFSTCCCVSYRLLAFVVPPDTWKGTTVDVQKDLGNL